jgi:hypothetical protein
LSNQFFFYETQVIIIKYLMGEIKGITRET